MHPSVIGKHLVAAAALTAVLGQPTAQGADEKENLKIEFPKAQFVGTPVPVGGIARLEKPGKPVLTLPVPKGTALISKDKPVTSSETAPSIGDLTLVTDGDKDGADGSFVELGPGAHWVQIDLGAEYNLSAIAIWHYHKQARVYRDVIVEAASTPDMAKATVLYNNDDDNSSKKGAGKDFSYIETQHGRLIDGKGTKARYVRCWSNGNHVDDLNHYVEVEVWGLPAK